MVNLRTRIRVGMRIGVSIRVGDKEKGSLWSGGDGRKGEIMTTRQRIRERWDRWMTKDNGEIEIMDETKRNWM